MKVAPPLTAALTIAGVLFFLERIAGSAIIGFLLRHPRPPSVGLPVSVRLSANYGFVFGIPLPLWVMYGLSAGVLLVLTRTFLRLRLRRPVSIPVIIGYGLILAGAASNLFSRLYLGFVWDYIALRFFGLEGVWNLADFFILSGAILWWWRLNTSSQEMTVPLHKQELH